MTYIITYIYVLGTYRYDLHGDLYCDLYYYLYYDTYL